MAKFYNKILHWYEQNLIFKDSKTLVTCGNKHLYIDIHIDYPMYCQFCNLRLSAYHIPNYKDMYYMKTVMFKNGGYAYTDSLYYRKIIKFLLRRLKFIEYFEVNVAVNYNFKHKRIKSYQTHESCRSFEPFIIFIL